jgi:geranylgeranyl diphosphate synthase type I
MVFAKKLMFDKELIDESIKNFLSNNKIESSYEYVNKNYEYLLEYVSAEGKRLRPALVIEAYKALHAEDDGVDSRVVDASIAIELLHNATLVYDDIMDEDMSRRGAPGINQRILDDQESRNQEQFYDGKIFNRNSSRAIVSYGILDGTWALVLSSKALHDSKLELKKISRAQELLNDACIEAIRGQIMDIDFENKKNISEEEYLEMITLKTAKLFSAAVQIGAVLADATEHQCKKFAEYGTNIGIAFQLQDDILDVMKESQKGHEYGSDIKKGKRTLLIIKTLELCDLSDKKILESILGKDEISEQEIDIAVEMIMKYGAFDYCRNQAKDKLNKAQHALSQLKLDPDKLLFFEGLAEYALNRIK